MTSQTTTRRGRSPYFDAADVILGLLRSSPLAMWVNPESFSKYLERRLPEYVQDGVLDLEPIWQSITRIPGIQRQAMETFFSELSRQPLPWPTRSPHALGGATRVAIDEDKLQRGIDQMVALMESSTLKQSLSPDKFRRYLERRLPEMIDVQGIDLQPLETTLRKSLNCEAEALDAYLRRLHRFSLPWPIKDITPAAPTSSYKTSTSLRPLHTPPPLRETPPAHTSTRRTTPPTSNPPQPTSPTQANLRTAQKRNQQAALQQTSDTLVRLMQASPLSVFLRSDNFQRYLQRWLPEYTANGSLETQPIWKHLEQIPSVDTSALIAFFNEVLRQEFPFPVLPPEDFDNIKRRQATSASLQTLQPSDFSTRSSQPRSPNNRPSAPLHSAPSSPSNPAWADGTSYDSMISALERDLGDIDLDAIEVVQTAQGNTQNSYDLMNKPSSSTQNKLPNPRKQARSSSTQISALSSQLQSLQDADIVFDDPSSVRRSRASIPLPSLTDLQERARAFGQKAYEWNWQRIAVVSWIALGIAFFSLGIWWLSRPIKLGEAIDPIPYKRHLPVQQAFLNGPHLTFSLDPFYQHLWEPDTLRQQCGRLNAILLQKEIRTLRIYTTKNDKPYKLILTCHILRHTPLKTHKP